MNIFELQNLPVEKQIEYHRNEIRIWTLVVYEDWSALSHIIEHEDALRELGVSYES